jgi:Mor family transcriptional regulator
MSSNRYEATRHRFFASLDEYVQSALEELGIDADVRAHAGAAVADRVAEEFQGEDLYVPTDYAYKMSKRENEILDKHFSGVPRDELRRTYKLSQKGLTRLLRRAQARDPHLHQRKLL